jgi:hypothetical protein
MKERLRILKEEYQKGCRQLDLLDRKRAEARDTLLRISGAIQVLEELITDQPRSVEDAA